MAAYAALVSVMQILHQIKNHPSPPISLDKQLVESLSEVVTFLQEFLEGYNSPVSDSDEADPLEMRIADASYAAEDVIESCIVDNIKLVPETTDDDAESNIVDRIIPSGSESQKEPKNDGEEINFVDLYEGLKKVIEDMNLIKKDVMDIVAEKEVAQDQLQRQDSSASASLTRLDSTMVGFDDVRLELMDKLTSEESNCQVIPIVGMGGIGKTTLAKNIYAQPLIKDRFDICAWTTISQKYDAKEILCDLVSQAKQKRKEELSDMSEDELGLTLHKHLFRRRFLIVMDDMWSIDAWDKMQRFLPDNGNRSRIVVTTRLSTLGSQLANSYCLQMKFLDHDSSWKLFLKTVFGEESCPLELEMIGKKIVESCRGLPLSIVVMGGLLEKVERTKKCWESIRRNLNSLVNLEDNERCLKILKLSYNHLPVYLKPCFLYMGVFEEDSAIRVSTVVKLWVSEGFLKPISEESLETTAKGYIKELVDRNLILVDKLGSTGSVKYCKIHDLLRDLCMRESQKERFYHVVGQQSPPSTGSERCIVILRGSSKKKVLNAIESTPYARSCISDSEGVKLLPNLRLLRVLNVSKDRNDYDRHGYSLKEMFKLVNLRFVAVGAQGFAKLPSSINLIWSLQTLIIFHIGEKVNGCVEIWKMPQLRHFHFYFHEGLHLPDPPRDSIFIMENLQTLIGIKDLKFGKEVVRRISNIKKLGLIYPHKDKGSESNDDRYCLHNIGSLHKLESLSCMFSLADVDLKNLSFAHSLKKLNLTMFRFNYVGDMLAKIGSLPLLEKLILDDGFSKTGTWEVVEDQFPSLKFLSLKSFGDLEIWTTESSPFPCLEHLQLQELWLLKEIPTEIGEIPTLKSIVLDRCSASAVKSMKSIVEEQEELQGDDLPFKVEVINGSWEEESQELQNLSNPNFQVTLEDGFLGDPFFFDSRGYRPQS